MARIKSNPSFIAWLFGKKKRPKTKDRPLRRYVWMLIALITGSGGVAGASEYDVLRAIWRILRDRVYSQTVSAVPDQDPRSGVVQVYFSRPDQPPDQPGDIARAVVEAIEKTERTLDVAAFEVDNHVITDALVRATQRGVRVRLVTESNYINESGVLALQAARVPVVGDNREGALMHHKFMVFDRKAVWTGSMNFTENCAYRNNNSGVYIADPKLAENYATKFAWMFEQRKFGGAPSRNDRIPNPVVTLADGTQVENYFSTHDQPAKHIVEAVRAARRSVHFLAFSFTHDGIGRAMLDRAAAGVEVGGVFEKIGVSAGSSEYDRLRAAGLPVFLDGNPRNMHHKVIVIDGEIVVVGSFNFSENADRTNDENVLIIYNRAVAAKFEEEYQRVLKAAR